MGLQSIDGEGNLQWRCPHIGEDADQPCGVQNTAHISHEQIQWHGRPETAVKHHMVSLPPCTACAAQTFLKVHFSEQELKAPNMWLVWNDNWEASLQRLKHIVAQEHEPEEHEPEMTVAQLEAMRTQIQHMEIIKQAGGMTTSSHAMAHRHMEMARQLVASGKVPLGA